MRDGDWLVGWGCASTMYPTQLSPATARVTVTPQGAVKVQTAAHDIGTGAYTVVAVTASDKLGVGLDKIEVEFGDSDLPPAPADRTPPPVSAMSSPRPANRSGRGSRRRLPPLPAAPSPARIQPASY